MTDTGLDFVGGCFGGIAGVIAGHPLDTVKVRMQMQKQGFIYRGVVDCLIKIVKYESVTGLFKGMTSPLAAQAFINGLVFGSYGESYRRLYPSPYSVFLAGCCAGLAQTFVTSPVELVKIRMQMQGECVDYKKLPAHEMAKIKRYTGSFDCFWKILRTEGIRGVSKGFSATLLREVPSCGIYFWSYEKLSRLMSLRLPETRKAKSLTVFTAGGIAGVLSWVCNYPIDVVKSRIQADHSERYSGNIDCAIKCYRAEGYRVFFQGINSTIVRAFPTNAATFGAVALFSRLVFGDSLDSGHIK